MSHQIKLTLDGDRLMVTASVMLDDMPELFRRLEIVRSMMEGEASPENSPDAALQNGGGGGS